jgi:hypothetical protein
MKIPKIVKGQKELTPEQLEGAKEYAKKQIAKYLSCKHLDKKTIEKFALNAYKISGTKLPKKVRWFKSPEAMCAKWASVRDSVGASVRASVRDSVGASVRASVGASVRDSVWDSVGASVRASVWDSVGASVRAYYDADTWSFYGFFNDNFEKNKIVWLLKLSENVTGYAFYEKECWLVEKPIKLERDEQGRLHSSKGKAIEWRDKAGYYFIHGVRFDEKTFNKVTKKNVTLKTIFSLENMEQRMASLKLVGIDKFLKSSSSKLLDKSSRGNALYEIDNIFTQKAYYLSYKCPSTGREYVSGIDPEVGVKGSADESMAWKFSLTLDEYNKLEVET